MDGTNMHYSQFFGEVMSLLLMQGTIGNTVSSAAGEFTTVVRLYNAQRPLFSKNVQKCHCHADACLATSGVAMSFLMM
jgi:hypothetical protein